MVGPRHSIKQFLPSTRTSVIVPVQASDADEAVAQIAQIRRTGGAHLLEWRIDALLASGGDLRATAESVRHAAAEIPILGTIRSKAQGGAAQLDPVEAVQVYRELATHSAIDLADVEMLADPDVADQIVEVLHEHAIPVIGSQHWWRHTPARTELIDTVQQMLDRGADAAKIAAMPTSPADVLEVIAALLAVTGSERGTQSHGQDAACLPEAPTVIAIAMGELGRITRILGPEFAQAATYASVTAGSAPGQLPVELAAQILATGEEQ